MEKITKEERLVKEPKIWKGTGMHAVLADNESERAAQRRPWIELIEQTHGRPALSRRKLAGYEYDVQIGTKSRNRASRLKEASITREGFGDKQTGKISVRLVVSARFHTRQ